MKRRASDTVSHVSTDRRQECKQYKEGTENTEFGSSGDKG
jgi:hypothetical protein